jgi:hypothetical protein
MEKLIIIILKNKLEIGYHATLLKLMTKYTRSQRTTLTLLRVLSQVVTTKKNKLRVIFR